MGTRLFSTQVSWARHLHVDLITVFASGDYNNNEYNGYYTWARLGYQAPLTRSELDDLPDALSGATTIMDLMETDEGVQWWQVHGSSKTMVFDLIGESRSVQYLREYLRLKGIKGIEL